MLADLSVCKALLLLQLMLHNLNMEELLSNIELQECTSCHIKTSKTDLNKLTDQDCLLEAGELEMSG